MTTKRRRERRRRKKGSFDDDKYVIAYCYLDPRNVPEVAVPNALLELLHHGPDLLDELSEAILFF